MRDPKRIDRILDKLGKLWKTYPDFRFGQMLINYLFGDERLHWHLEDDDFEKVIDKALKKTTKEQKQYARNKKRAK